jgi:hypothetical protein
MIDFSLNSSILATNIPLKATHKGFSDRSNYAITTNSSFRKALMDQDNLPT